jgi:hypothetical protein
MTIVTAGGAETMQGERQIADWIARLVQSCNLYLVPCGGVFKRDEAHGFDGSSVSRVEGAQKVKKPHQDMVSGKAISELS